jgi:hypothetical protein
MRGVWCKAMDALPPPRVSRLLALPDALGAWVLQFLSLHEHIATATLVCKRVRRFARMPSSFPTTLDVGFARDYKLDDWTVYNGFRDLLYDLRHRIKRFVLMDDELYGLQRDILPTLASFRTACLHEPDTEWYQKVRPYPAR